MKEFKPGDIVVYIKGNSDWVKNQYKFKVLQRLTEGELRLEVLQQTEGPRFRSGEHIDLYDYKLQHVIKQKDPHPIWW